MKTSAARWHAADTRHMGRSGAIRSPKLARPKRGAGRDAVSAKRASGGAQKRQVIRRAFAERTERAARVGDPNPLKSAAGRPYVAAGAG
jgi:hypothetical protein